MSLEAAWDFVTGLQGGLLTICQGNKNCLKEGGVSLRPASFGDIKAGSTGRTPYSTSSGPIFVGNNPPIQASFS